MLVWLAEHLSVYFTPLNLFSYITFRAAISMFFSAGLCVFLGRPLIRLLGSLQFSQVVREDGPKTHLIKKGTPTMGGVLMLLSLSISLLLFADLKSAYLWLVWLGTLGFGLIGLLDDLLKVYFKHPKGLMARFKFSFQVILTLVLLVPIYLLSKGEVSTSLYFPIFKNLVIPLGFLFILFSVCVVVGSSNSVNMSDGMDGLAAILVLMVAVVLGVYAYVESSSGLALYLHQPHLKEVSELPVFCASLVGVCLGFLWFNSYPATLFMGDVGSLALGGALGLVAVLIRQEIILFIAGFLFVLETLSVFIQVGVYKARKKRVFLMAPLHHHFEQMGLHETKVLMRFWIIGFLLALLCLMFLKVR